MKKSSILNFISLSAIQAANALTPLVLFPFALATVGSDAYSALVTTEAASILISVLVIYSFEIDGHTMVARLKGPWQTNDVSAIFSCIFYARLLIFVTAAIFFIPVAWLIFDNRTAFLFMLWLGVPFSYALQPNWLFQAIERNFGISVIVLGSRLAAVFIVFFNINDPEGVILIPATIASCYVLGSIMSLVYLKVVFGIRLQSTRFVDVWKLILDGKHVFLGNFSVALYREVNVLILGLMGVAASSVAAYSLAEKIVKGVQAVTRPLNQMFFPKALRLLSNQVKPSGISLNILWKLLYPQLIFLLFLAFTVIIIWLYFLPDDLNIKNVPNRHDVLFLFCVMIFAVFFGVANFMLGSAGLNFLGEKKYMMKSIFLAGILSVINCLIFVFNFGSVGAAISFVMAEGVLFFLIIRKYIKNRVSF